jgi:hypothetical protein
MSPVDGLIPTPICRVSSFRTETYDTLNLQLLGFPSVYVVNNAAIVEIISIRWE